MLKTANSEGSTTEFLPPILPGKSTLISEVHPLRKSDLDYLADKQSAKDVDLQNIFAECLKTCWTSF
jgi:hypothetical protein